MTPLEDFESLLNDKNVVTARLREYITALLVMRDRLTADEEHLRDFIDFAVIRFRNKIDLLNEKSLHSGRRLHDVSPNK